jgi:hypothetical protein
MRKCAVAPEIRRSSNQGNTFTLDYWLIAIQLITYQFQIDFHIQTILAKYGPMGTVKKTG